MRFSNRSRVTIAGLALASLVGVATVLATATPATAAAAWLSISAGDQHTCGIVANGGLYCWGGNADGQLGVVTPPTGPYRPGSGPSAGRQCRPASRTPVP